MTKQPLRADRSRDGRSIRILDPAPQGANDERAAWTGFSTRLEERARAILERATAHERRHSELLDPVTGSLEAEIALVVDQIDRLAELRSRQDRSLLHAECDVGTELVQMEARTPRYSPDRFPEREKFMRQLSQIAQERRRQDAWHIEQLARLHDRLLHLVNRRGYLTPADRDPEDHGG